MKKLSFTCTERFSGLSVDEISDRLKRQRAKEKKERSKHTFEKEDLSSRESRVSLECPYCHCMEYSRYVKTRQGIQRYRCLRCGRICVIADGKDLSSSKLTADELFSLVKCIYLELPVKSACIITGIRLKQCFYGRKEHSPSLKHGSIMQG